MTCRVIVLTDFDGHVLNRVHLDPTAPATEVSDAISDALYAAAERYGIDDATFLALVDHHTLRVLR